MSDERRTLRLDEKLKAEDELYATLFHPSHAERKPMMISIAIAVVIHVIFLVVNFPDVKAQLRPKKPEKVVYVKKYVPPPPKIERKQIVKKQITKKVPVPDPTPDEPEPIREPEPDIEPEPLPPDVEVLLGDPEPPPPTGPLMAGVGDVSNPVIIMSTKVQPEYPELARRARLEGSVILQAIVYKDGTVGEIEVLRCTRPNVGFEAAAVAAVQNWRYQPATQNGKPVDVFFTINVTFELQ